MGNWLERKPTCFSGWVVHFDYPPELCALLRPFSGNSYYEKDKVVDEKRKAKLEDLWKQLETTQLEFKFESSLPGAK
jgi:hypothetical protein